MKPRYVDGPLSAYYVVPSFVVGLRLTLQQKTEMRNNVPSDVIRFVFPPMNNGAKIMHSKLQLLKYPKHLRIAVPTGNLVPYDWGETGTMENVANPNH